MNQNSWLYSDSFMKRAFAIWGHYFVANIIIAICFFVIFLLITMTLGISFGGFSNGNVDTTDDLMMEDFAQ